MSNLVSPKALLLGLLLSLAPFAGGCIPMVRPMATAPQPVYVASPQPVYVAPAPQPVYYQPTYYTPAPQRVYVQPAPTPYPTYRPAPPPRVVVRPGVHGHVRVHVGRR